MSAKGFWVSQDGHLGLGLAPVSAGAAQKTARFNLELHDHVSGILQFGAAGGPVGLITVLVYPAVTGGTGVAIPFRVVKFEQASTPFDVATNNSASNNSIFYEPATGFQVTETSSEDIASAMYIFEIEASDVLVAANGTYVEIDIAVGSLGTTPQLMSALWIGSGGRFTGDQSASAQV